LVLPGAGPLWVCEGAIDAQALLTVGVPRVVATFGVQGWRWAWAVRALVFALDAAVAGPPSGHASPPGAAAAPLEQLTARRSAAPRDLDRRRRIG